MRNLPKAGFAAAIALFLADQISKWAVTKPLGIDSLGESQTITSFFDLRFVPNIGISLGLLPADGHLTRWALVLLTGAIAVGVAVWMTREKNPADQVALGFVLGGAIGNILDRIRLGYVVDFCDLHIGEWRPFLVFNVADAAITVGVLVLLVRALLVREKPPVENSHA
jgi:signal peptidase II